MIIGRTLMNPPLLNLLLIAAGSFLLTGCNGLPSLGEQELIRTYVEFADGSNRGMVDPETGRGGLPDEDFDATTSVVINWHRLPEPDPQLDARLHYRLVHPNRSDWMAADGESVEFWYRDERVNRVQLRDLEPGSVYEYRVLAEGEIYRFRTMPASLEDQSVKIIMTGDHQSPSWSRVAHDNARMAALQEPDMFVVAGDFVNDEGRISPDMAERWVTYLDYLYKAGEGYFITDREIDGELFRNLVIPHVVVLGNHETGQCNHIRWPACVNTGMAEPGYPQFVAANWMELLFHWPFRSEGFLSEFHPDHPNMDPDHVREGFGHGGFGSLSFGDYLLLVGMDNSQNWEGAPDRGLRDWKGDLITDTWPWFETHHSEVRQDQWLRNLLEPEGEKSAGEVYSHILPVWHRGLYGTVRLNMSLKNREIFRSWLPLLYRNGVKLIKEAHDHSFTRTVPMNMTMVQPENTRIEKVYYEPASWPLTENLTQEYLDDFYAVNTLVDEQTGEVVGWEYDGVYSTFDPQGMIAIGHGGWSADRREPGGRGGGNAGLWFVDPEQGGEAFGGDASFHMTTVHLTVDDLTVEAFHPDQLHHFENETDVTPIHRFRWDLKQEKWYLQVIHSGEWERIKNNNYSSSD